VFADDGFSAASYHVLQCIGPKRSADASFEVVVTNCQSSDPHANRTSLVRKLPARYATIVLPLVLSIVMTFIISGVSTLRSLGLTPAFLSTWMTAWALSWVVAFPTLLILLPLVRRAVACLVEVSSETG
jgi:hypothetical protein